MDDDAWETKSRAPSSTVVAACDRDVGFQPGAFMGLGLGNSPTKSCRPGSTLIDRGVWIGEVPAQATSTSV